MAEHDAEKATREFLKFGDAETEEKECHCFKKAVHVKKVYIKKIFASDEFAYGKNKETDAKCLIAYKTDKKLNHYLSRFHK